MQSKCKAMQSKFTRLVFVLILYNYLIINEAVVLFRYAVFKLREKGCIIVSSANEARENLAYNSERDAAEVELEEGVNSFSIEVENEDENGYYTETFKVVVTAYYEDAGSNDYYYKVEVK